MTSKAQHALARPVVLLACLLGSAGEGGEARPAEHGPSRYAAGRQLCQLASKKIDESSGLACSRRTAGVFWTHNDSGGEARLFAFDTTGALLATVQVVDAGARDWEDIASFRRRGQAYLLAGDVGDNAWRRDSCTLYVVPEPRLDPKKGKRKLKIKAAQAIRFRYEDGPRNCESVAIDPTDGTIFLVSKELAFGCTAYALPWPKHATKEVLVARRVAEIKLSTTTAMDISPDGRRAVILTYGPAFEFVRAKGETWAKALAREPRSIPMPRRNQGESICYGPDGKTLYLTSEKLPTPLLEVPVLAGSAPH